MKSNTLMDSTLGSALFTGSEGWGIYPPYRTLGGMEEIILPYWMCDELVYVVWETY